MTGAACHEFREHAPELALGLLTGDERGGAIDHLALCSSCRAHLEGLVQVADDLLMLAPAVEPDIGFESRLMARLAAEGAFSAPTSPVQPATNPAASPPPSTPAASTAPPALVGPDPVAPVIAVAAVTPTGPGDRATAEEPFTPGTAMTAVAPTGPGTPVTPSGPDAPVSPLGEIAARESPIAPIESVTPDAHVTAVTPASPDIARTSVGPVVAITSRRGPSRVTRRPARLVVTGVAALVAAALAIASGAAGLQAGRGSGRASALRSEASAVNQLGARAVIVRADGGQSTCRLVAFPSDGSHPAWVAIHLDEPGEPPSSYLVYAEPADGGPAVLVGTIPVVDGQGSLTAVMPAGIGPVHGVRIIDVAPTVKYRATFAPI